MKRNITAVLLIVCIGTLGAVDLESYQFIDYLLGLPGPGAPQIYEDAVVFTASGDYRRVGIAFAHENFSKVHYFQKLLVPKDAAEVAANAKNKSFDPYRETGLLFYVETITDDMRNNDMRNMDYRLIIDGLWTVDPLNPQGTVGSGGMFHSRVALPSQPRSPSTLNAPAGQLHFSFSAPPGQIITVAGTFNNWDPFMYELRETGTGVYSLYLALPPGTYEYVFFYRGERLLDPNNPSKVYTGDGRAVSQAQVR